MVFSPPDDHSRVVLTQLDGNPCSDYVNASYTDVSYDWGFFIIHQNNNYCLNFLLANNLTARPISSSYGTFASVVAELPFYSFFPMFALKFRSKVLLFLTLDTAAEETISFQDPLIAALELLKKN